jgi:hypothetical protein
MSRDVYYGKRQQENKLNDHKLIAMDLDWMGVYPGILWYRCLDIFIQDGYPGRSKNQPSTKNFLIF